MSLKEILVPEKPLNVLVVCLLIVAVTVVAVWALNHESVYNVTDKNLSQLTGKLWDESRKCPTGRGVLVHALVGGLVVALVVYLARRQLVDLALRHLNN